MNGAGRRSGTRRPVRGAGGGAVFDPTQVTGRLLDLWADAGVTEAGTGVSSWVDRVASYDFVQGTDANRPSLIASWRNGRRAIDFNGTSDLLTRAFGADALLAAGTDNTVYLFGEADTITPGAASSFVIDALDGRQVCTLSASGGVGWYDTNYRPTAETTTGAHSWCWALDHAVASGSKCYADGTLLGSATVSALGLGGTIAIGRSAAGAAAWFDGKVGRLLVYSGLHDAATRANIIAWGRSYYGLP